MDEQNMASQPNETANMITEDMKGLLEDALMTAAPTDVPAENSTDVPDINITPKPTADGNSQMENVAAAETPDNMIDDHGGEKDGMMGIVAICLVLVVIAGGIAAMIYNHRTFGKRKKKYKSGGSSKQRPSATEIIDEQLQGGASVTETCIAATEIAASVTEAGDVKADAGIARTEAPGTSTEAISEKDAVYRGPQIMVGGAQTVGARKNQQDAMYYSDCRNGQALATRGLLAAVADGIGGLADGDIASSSAMQMMRSRFLTDNPLGSLSERLLELAAAAQEEVLRKNRTMGTRSGSTLVSVLIFGGKMVYLSIGDSRICLYRAGGLLQLNREHNLGRTQAEEDALGKSRSHASGKASALTSYLGKEDLRLIDRSIRPMELVPGDRIVLMSDGVFGTLSDAEICSCLALPPDEAAKAIVREVDHKNKKYQDNASVLVIGIG